MGDREDRADLALMRAARAESDERIPLEELKRELGLDEPTFVLRASDPLAAELVRLWAQRAYQRGEDLRKVEHALRVVTTMEKWNARES